MWTNGVRDEKRDAVMPLTSKHAAFCSRSTPYFTALSRVESCSALKQYLFAVTIAKSGANACTKCPTVAILHHSFPTSSYSSRTWLGNCSGDISKWMVSSISVSSALPKGPFFSSRFIPLLASSQFVAVYARSDRSNMSAHSLLPAIEKLDFAVQINRRLVNDIDGNCGS